jgi:hypothetical protein
MFFINPFIYAGGGDFESIATVTVGSGGASSAEFTSIPSTYQHLQVRIIARRSAGIYRDMSMTINTSSGMTRRHALSGDGSSVSAGSDTANSFGFLVLSTDTASVFAAAVVDILDYASTSKTKVLRTFTGNDRNGSGNVGIFSALYDTTSAISSIKIEPYAAGTDKFAEHSTFALYGVKAP